MSCWVSDLVSAILSLLRQVNQYYPKKAHHWSNTLFQLSGVGWEGILGGQKLAPALQLFRT